MGEVPSAVFKSLSRPPLATEAYMQPERRPLKCYGEPGEGDGANASASWSYNFRDPLKGIQDPFSVVKVPSAMVEASLAKEAPSSTLAGILVCNSKATKALLRAMNISAKVMKVELL